MPWDLLKPHHFYESTVFNTAVIDAFGPKAIPTPAARHTAGFELIVLGSRFAARAASESRSCDAINARPQLLLPKSSKGLCRRKSPSAPRQSGRRRKETAGQDGTWNGR